MGCCQCMTPRVRVPRRNRQTRPGTRPGTRTVLAVVAFALALPALLLLGLATPTDTDSKSIMVVHYACMACQSGCSADSYFTTYQQAASHYANSARCNQSVRGIATVVLPSRPTDVEAGGSGAAEAWAGPPRRGGPVRRQRISAGGDFMLLYHKNKYDFKCSLYHSFYDFRNSLYHSFVYIPIRYHGVLEFSGYQQTSSYMISYP
jgi:hypothetical protein